ncbi:TMAO reductase system periplasmic protein TorT [Vibrio parahaemolyticus]|uniref:TMAO reductase system periplasmic protein TorT n=1 Tax=Vibrio parahaemolyticus TaxID=670 RepID=UPI0023EDD457|nr:TMAO reductase system periplasmic protein TorT [Vibrio parahaemolyticus]
MARWLFNCICMKVKHLPCLLFYMLVASAGAVGLEPSRAPETWFVKSFEPPFESVSNVRDVVVQPLEKATKQWLICILVPHLKDPAWRGVNFGLSERARQLNISFFVMSAGGYLQTERQKEQFDVCVKRNPDAIILGSNNETDLVEQVAELKGRIPVFLLMNEFPTDIVQGWVGPSWYENEAKLISIAKNNQGKQKLLWLSTLGGSKESLQGVVDSANRLKMDVVMSSEVDNAFAAHQFNLIKLLSAHPDITDVAGPAMAIEYTSSFLYSNIPESEIDLYSSYYIPSLYRLIKLQRVKAAIDQRVVLAGLLSMEMAVRYLEGKPLPKFIDVVGEALSYDNIDKIDKYYSFPPYGWQGSYSYNYELPYPSTVRQYHMQSNRAKQTSEHTYQKPALLLKDLKVVSWDNEHSLEGKKTIDSYSFLQSSRHPWKLCALYPNMHDDYWISINYGMVKHATNLGVELIVFEASGYDGITDQREQIVECLNRKVDAIILGATSGSLLQAEIAIAALSTPVFSLVNYIPNEYVSGRVGVSWYDVGLSASELLHSEIQQNPEIDKVGWFGSPIGRGGSEALKKGILDGMAEYGKTLSYVSHSPNTTDAKRTEIIKMLKQLSDIDCIVAGGAAIKALLAEKVQHRLGEDVCLIADYFSHSALRGLLRGRVSSANTDQMVAQGMLSIDQAVRHLEGKEYLKNMGPEVLKVTPENLKDFQIQFSLNPSSFQPTFYVPARNRD